MGLSIKKDFTRPWGGFIKFIDQKPCTVKILQIKKGESLSLQFHKLREEFWYVVSGKIRLTLGLKQRILKEDNHVFIPKRCLHRAKALKDSKILEISIGKFQEQDIVRVKDEYGRK
jgi:mannose-6-phosphate isomerase-like protein (cupin superfamily)